MMTEAQERFLRAIADRVPAASIAELHLFPAIRQGGYETGIAVIAAEPDEPDGTAMVRPAAPEADAPEEEAAAAADMPEQPEPGEMPGIEPHEPPPHRLIVLSARYRLTLKGPDRGRWDVEVVAQADAPLVTVDAVVRGVQRRAGDVGDPERIGGDALRALLDEWSCTATTR